ncbi:hypothetical protein [Mucilaginibacter sp.]|uniref:hypothetical protein n=1 Tax=Mucilaginibacter sp. TaxID=1882438 RepID=UPI0025D3F0C4|nr:hypothetical protein [Mucilaginibacter sp.]
MDFDNFLKGEIVHDIENHCWGQFVEEKDGFAVLFDRLGRNREVDIDYLIKAELPLALDALGFQQFFNDKKGTEKYKHNGNTIDVINGKYFIRNIQIFNTVEVQIACNQFRFISFNLLARRMRSRTYSRINNKLAR